MDRRKSTGRTAEELRSTFNLLPDARHCFDVGHARQCDTSMAESYRILEAYGSRLAQLHVSEVNSASQHDPITYATKLGFQSIAHLIPAHIPLIIESRVPQGGISKEIRMRCSKHCHCSLKQPDSWPSRIKSINAKGRKVTGPKGTGGTFWIIPLQLKLVTRRNVPDGKSSIGPPSNGRVCGYSC